MNDYKLILAAFIAVMFAWVAPVFADETAIHPPGISPVGYWKTIDDATGKPKSIVQIWKTENNILMGKVIKVFAAAGKSERCSACEGDMRNQPLVGMVILSNLKPEATQWGNGRIVDVNNGKMYQCAVRLTEKGKKLNVKNYIGFPLFGHSQTWERVDLMSG